ncbi:MAG: hypothetical protein M1817_001823 [Caeruleum heppii]|nr:MAG: hypothetical protein M1817_001823 [Caeruleum heppii]
MFGLPSPTKLPRRERHYSARAFYITVLVISALAVLSLLADLSARHGSGILDKGQWQRRLLVERSGIEGWALTEMDQDCKLVHHAPDKCAFIRANCPDEEAGLFSYLTFYYCTLPTAKPVAFILMALWLGLLFTTIGIAASDFFCINLSTISSLLGMSESMAGVTFLAFGNGSPDVFSTFAAMSTHSGSLAIGELIGAAGFITAVVAGSMALVRPFHVARKSFVRDVGFFIVATSFSMAFLADGHLHLWECAVMVGFYVFYVCTVVVWHWWLGHRKRGREREVAARGHYYAPENEELEVAEEEVDDDGPAGERNRLLSRRSTEDFAALERGGLSPNIPAQLDDEPEDDPGRERWLAELNSNMRISRRPRGERRPTLNPIRPSLVGALEFRAVLSSLQKSRNIQTTPINLRRYSDDPSMNLLQAPNGGSYVSDPEVRSTYRDEEVSPPEASPSATRLLLDDEGHASKNRGRAVSVNDAGHVRLDRDVTQKAVPQIDLLSSSPPGGGIQMRDNDTTEASSTQQRPASPSFSLSPPASAPGSRPTTPHPPERVASSDRLAPPHPNQNRRHPPQTLPPTHSPRQPHPKLSIPHSAQRHRSSRGSSPSSPFPAYTDSPTAMSTSRSSPPPPHLYLPPPSLSMDSPSFSHPVEEQSSESKPLRWWPYRFLPPPLILISTFFPTLYGWRDKNLWEKFLGVVAAPSVLLLTLTLPVVEADGDDSQDDTVSETAAVLTPGGSQIPIKSTPNGREESRNDYFSQAREHTPHHDIHHHGQRTPRSPSANGFGGHGNTAHVAAVAEDHRQHPHSHHHHQPSTSSHITHITHIDPTHLTSTSPPCVPSKEWNRPLVLVHCLTSPLFITLIFLLNLLSPPLTASSILKPLLLYSLPLSLLIFLLVLFTTTPHHPPPWRLSLCFLGFLVSICWISTIANEVVGVLKAIGVILGISDAILGLTIFAVGNSLGDLVADITVARLGFPVMALSACFGGPMLNILLGVGLSGLYMTIKESTHHGKHHKHHHSSSPSSPPRYKPYQISVSSTLIISAAVLLVTLVGLLIVVPLNGWKMDRRIGWSLIGLWTVGTMGNVVVEVTGWGGRVS